MKFMWPLIFFTNSLYAATIVQFKQGIESIPEQFKKELSSQHYDIKPMKKDGRFFIQRMPETTWDIIKKESNLAIRINDDINFRTLQKHPLIQKVLEDEPSKLEFEDSFALKSPSKDFPNFPCENTIYWGGEKANFTQSLEEAKPCDGYWIAPNFDEKITFEVKGGKILEIFEDGVLKAQTDASMEHTFSTESREKIVVVRGSPGKYELSWHSRGDGKIPKNLTLPDFSNLFGFGGLEISQAYQILTQKNLTKGRSPKHRGAQMMNVGMLWSEGFKGQNVRVAVIDTGVDFNHPFLKDVVEDGFNVIEPDKKPVDDESHGTHVAGIIHQVAPQAKIVPIKVLDKDGSGSVKDVIAGIAWAIKEKVQVINLSLGGDIDQEDLKNVFKKAQASGILVVMASGNEAAKEPTFPARYVAKIPDLGFAVGALTSSWELTDFSDRSGPHKSMKYVAANGVNVSSSVPGGGYKKYSGTSMATPQVAGALALIKSIPNLKDNKSIINAFSQSVYQTAIEY